MKYLFLFCLSFLLLGNCINANAGFIIKKYPVTTYSSAASVNAMDGKTVVHKHNSFLWRIHPYGHGHREARIAFWYAMFGLLLPPLGVFAIVHGGRSVRRGRRRENGLAIASIIIGGVEVLLCIAYFFLLAAFVIVL